jgi:hypothetical protein
MGGIAALMTRGSIYGCTNVSLVLPISTSIGCQLVYSIIALFAEIPA